MRFFPTKRPEQKANDRTIDILVTGMTCQKCVEHVTEALKSLETVKRVSVLLRTEEPSQVTILTDYEIEDQVIRDTIKDAGYEVVAIERDQ
ncbi:MAG: heavy-metal-associated domain-containing protein [Varibaculum cambriense]|uniref:heavy-metal-associated domain-containing protein n=1 Tax=Varibaculum cambriense TaxID=184870 RepID=UPI001ED6A2B9|nr:heavy metal-associated domain-containing protein [Varibaculum cambriense]MBS5918196.1 heavy-metal-associated domain-containing protein [Varibaculum cambriense]